MSDSEWMAAFRQRAVSRRVPISGILELTSRCNLKCVHCYLGPQEEQRKKRDLEMSTEQALGVIDQVVASGCLYLVITGGDPMVRKDFPQVYRYAREKGLIVTVFCDGILVNDRIVRLFQELPPFNVDISVYGATAETYEAVTRIKGSFPRFLRGIERLAEGGVPFSLKTVLMTVNRHELEGMRQIAADRGVKFRVDSAIFPCLPTQDHEPLDLRVEPEEAVELELSDADHLQQWVDYADARKGAPAEEHLYNCGAGVTNFYVDPLGYASPCLMTTNYRYPLAERGFAGLWADELVQLRSKKPRDGYTCNSCEVKVACTGCPAFNYQENGHEDIKSEYVCETTRHRYAAIEAARGGKAAAVARRMARRRAVRGQSAGTT
ncbi:MAG: radical SAM protein [bacterium]|nr:radical SAM protein [bacterium]